MGARFGPVSGGRISLLLLLLVLLSGVVRDIEGLSLSSVLAGEGEPSAKLVKKGPSEKIENAKAEAQAKSGTETRSRPSEPEPARGVTLEEVTVTGRAEAVLSETVLDAESLSRAGERPVSDLLRTLVSVSVSQQDRGEWSFMLRGFDQRQVLVLVDGVPLLSPYDGRVDVGKFPAGLLKEIQVIQAGSLRTVWPVGLGGAVNLRTREAGKGRAAVVRAEGAYPAAHAENMTFSRTFGPVGLLLTGGYRKDYGWPLSGRFEKRRNEDGGLRENSDSADGHAGGKLSLHVGRHALEATGYFLRGDYGAPPHAMAIPPRYWRWEPWTHYQTQLAHRWRAGRGLRFEERVFASGLENTLRSYDDDRYRSQDGQAAYTSTYDERQAGFSVGFDGRWRPGFVPAIRLRPSLMGRHVSHAEHWKGEEETEPELSAFRLSGGLLNDWKVLNWLGFSIGMTYEGEFPLEHPEGGDEKSMHFAGPLAGVNFTPLDGLRLDLSFTRRGRFPTFKERFSGAQDRRIPNPDLRPERAWHTAFDLSWRVHASVGLKLSAYVSFVNGLIRERAMANGMVRLENIDETLLAGTEARIGYRPFSTLRLEGSYAFLHARKRSHEPGDEKLLYRPEHKAKFLAVYKPFRWWDVSTDVEAVGSQRYQNDLNGRYGTFGAYFIWSARTAFPVSFESGEQVEFWLRADNLLDTNYQGRFGFPGPGRRFWTGLSVALDPR